MSLLKQLASSNYISVNKTMIKLFGLEEAVILGELCSEYDYWETEDKLEYGNMFYCTVAKLQENTGLTEYQQRKAIKHLEEIGILSINLHGTPATRYFELHEDKIFSFLRSRSEKTKDLDPEKLRLSNNINNKNNNNKVLNNKLFKTTPDPNVKSKKDNLYTKCVKVIDEFTNDPVLKDPLITFLKQCLENSRESGMPFYTNTFKGKLNSLKKLSDNPKEQTDIVLQTLNNGWNRFYAVKDDRKEKNATQRLEHLPNIHRESIKEEFNGDDTGTKF